MSGSDKDKIIAAETGDQPSPDGTADPQGGSRSTSDESPKSLAARRRRIEMMRERQQLRAELDDFGDEDFTLDLESEIFEDDDVYHQSATTVEEDFSENVGDDADVDDEEIYDDEEDPDSL